MAGPVKVLEMIFQSKKWGFQGVQSPSRRLEAVRSCVSSSNLRVRGVLALGNPSKPLNHGVRSGGG